MMPDTSFANRKRVNQLANQEMYAGNRIYGKILQFMVSDRTKENRHFISRQDWPWSYFPPFSGSQSWILSSDTLPRLLMAASSLPNVELPDVYMTGLLPNLMGIQRIDASNFIGIGKAIKNDILQYRKKKKKINGCRLAQIGIVDEVQGTEDMFELEKSIGDVIARNISCKAEKNCTFKVDGKCWMYGRADDED